MADRVRERFGSHLITADEVELEEIVGEGAFGVVWKSRVRGTTVAVKIPKKQYLSESQYAAFLSEVEIMSKINHKNICLFMGACVQPGNIRIATELMVDDLHGLVMDTERFPVLPLSKRLGFALDAARGVAWLHGNRPTVLHRDLKLANMLYDENSVVKVCDFGLSQFMEEEETRDIRPKGSPLYQAPEVLNRGAITTKVDVYALGIILWEIVQRSRAFPHHKQYNPFKNAILGGERPPIAEGTLPSLADLMRRCWAADPAARPEMTDIIAALTTIVEEARTQEQAEAVDKKVSEASFAAFWKQNFLGKTTVSWNKFSKALYRHLGLPMPIDPTTAPLPRNPTESQIANASDEQLEDFVGAEEGGLSAMALAQSEIARREAVREGSATYQFRTLRVDVASLEPEQHALLAMKLVFCTGRKDLKVKIKRFAHVANCFGPMDNELPFRIGKMVLERWFFTIEGPEAAESLLEKVGSYLLRFSASKAFTFSYVAEEGDVKHLPVDYNQEDRTYIVAGEVYPSLRAIIQSRDYMRIPVSCQDHKSLQGFEYPDDA
eukprot:TRINITY_DN475_c0_g1_i2.p1 TRINITY_DN475_c0_g1~~TRINITY_DN475_c0_g1_i2.p1  ORF type:complete len:551 (-),score=188.99 TRINITY_DN475_c0_g1_i2:747-2399(-)